MPLIYSVLIVLGYINCLLVSSQYVDLESPCPKTFEYETDGSRVYGVIHLQPNGPISFIHIIANFTIATRLYSNYVGRLEPIDTSALQLQQFYQNTPIDYRVHFPVTFPLPHLTTLVVNDNFLCYGPADVPQRPNEYVTTISLQHKLSLRGGQGFNSFNKVQPSRPQSQPLITAIGVPPNQDMYTLNLTKNPDGSWNAVPAFSELSNQPTQPLPQSPSTQQLVFPMISTINTRKPVPPPPPRRPEIISPSVPSRLPSTPSSFECGVVSGGNEYVPLIYHGMDYARGEWPWLVAIYKRNDGTLSFICSGTLVSNRHVVTAAHCMQQRNMLASFRDIVIKVGVYDLEDWGDDVTVTRKLSFATIHDQYNSSYFANDILVLTLERVVEFNTYIRPACLWSGNSDISRIVGASGVVAGWGASELGPGSKGQPRVVRVPVVSTATCRASNPDFHALTNAKSLCAGDRKGAGPCVGDSGGGLYLLDGGRWRLRGVVSVSLRPKSGDNTCDLSQYIIFTDAAQYLQWIENVIKY